MNCKKDHAVDLSGGCDSLDALSNSSYKQMCPDSLTVSGHGPQWNFLIRPSEM